MRGTVFILALIALGVALQKGIIEIPRQWAPWAPLHIDDPITPVTKLKLKRLEGDRQGCLAALDTVPASELDYTPVADYSPTASCPLSNIVRINSSSVRFNRSFVASCPMALAWVMFERHELQPAAVELMSSRVSQVDHVGSFACRNVYGRSTGRRSEHATAEALDVTGFRFENGQRITLISNWDDEGAVGAFFRAARDGACKSFGNVLGPNYNAAHADHFHMGMRGYGLCR
ncbi:extensin family protein [Halomonas sp. PAMB 3264]|uniref:extensin-like domain-containing protein n=1 Tax=unclassified Halomonas TaxID=2609666 RepID=UPI00289B20FC|nr:MULTISPECIES: extensin family protein [unclassified Halomonas]WNL39003.1 extensin family protein [Halomonas sp. PAMB 3232]WNL42353.1 extensin family protein [Halomonas sp. PAMB 3264]